LLCNISLNTNKVVKLRNYFLH